MVVFAGFITCAFVSRRFYEDAVSAVISISSTSIISSAALNSVAVVSPSNEVSSAQSFATFAA